MPVLNAEVATALSTNQLQHLLLPTSLFGAAMCKHLQEHGHSVQPLDLLNRAPAAGPDGERVSLTIQSSHGPTLALPSQHTES